eukprot:CCRYP_003805-RA/>CCRYP_003805-RA protein AED:0.05 eAED:0.05 QI:384/1/1/1/1/1/3/364/426
MRRSMIRLIGTAFVVYSGASAFSHLSCRPRKLITPYYVHKSPRQFTSVTNLFSSPPNNGPDNPVQTEVSKAPTLNGKIILPVKAMSVGLKGHKVAAVYAVLNSGYKRGSGDGWDYVEHVGITRDLASDINYFLKIKGSDTVAHIRALSFSYPQKATMEDFANTWRFKVQETGRNVGYWGKVQTDRTDGANEEPANDTEFDDDDDDDMDEDELDDYLEMMAETRVVMQEATDTPPPPLFVDNSSTSGVVSPFAQTTSETPSQPSVSDDQSLELTSENVDKVLDEVRPYLISDGGNVSVQKVDGEFGNVYLMLEGACGSCASSTVTMKMGIERVLKEKFGAKLNDVIQVDPEGSLEEGKPTELTMDAVQAEVKRLSQAINAMGGVVRVVSVDPIGVVEIEFRGPNKVRKGLELALLDVEFVKHVNFIS